MLSPKTKPYIPQILDPGDAGAIPCANGGYVELVSAGGAQTRTVKAPAKDGLKLFIRFLTDGGDIVVTFPSAINQAGNNTATYADAGDYQELTSSNGRWLEVKNDGAALSTV